MSVILRSAASAMSSPKLWGSLFSLRMECSFSQIIASEYFMRKNGRAGRVKVGLRSATAFAITGLERAWVRTVHITSSR